MKNGMSRAKRAAPRTRVAIRAIACAAALALVSGNAFPISRDQAKRIYDRIAGVPASDAQLTSMASMSANAAAIFATNDPAFYNTTIRNLATPWTNRDQTVFAPLNDYTATVIGMVRDDVPFNTLLSADSSGLVRQGLSPDSVQRFEAVATFHRIRIPGTEQVCRIQVIHSYVETGVVWISRGVPLRRVSQWRIVPIHSHRNRRYWAERR